MGRSQEWLRSDFPPSIKVIDLLDDQVAQIIHVKKVADLFTRAAIADVTQRSLEMMSHDPKRSNALVDLAKLPRPGNDSAAINNGLNHLDLDYRIAKPLMLP